ncbi:MAG: HlyC/CorC family transporter [Phycisphaerales bacterium]|nr:HlyC/CorC family transporter [Phycisphaerales bacterium]
MNIELSIALIAVLAVTTFLSALNLALSTVSPTAIERRCAATNRVSAGSWINAHSTALEHAVALFRTFGRLSSVLVVLLIVHPNEGVAALQWQPILIALTTSSLLVWATTSVTADAIARHGGVGLIVGTYPVLRLCYWLTRPILWIAALTDEAVRRLLGAVPTHKTVEQELLHTISDTARAGGLDAISARIIRNAVEFRSTAASEVMTPRTQIEGIEYTDDLAVIRSFIETAGHSRIPVFRENMDQVVGILYVKDLVRFLGTSSGGFQLSTVLRQPARVPETKPVCDLLMEFQRSEIHLALVVDEFGGTAGLITIEDVLEEIVGEIYDEHEPMTDIPPQVTGTPSTGWEVDGRVPLMDVVAATSLALPTEGDFDTVAGLVLLNFGRIPLVGESFSSYGARFTVVSSTPVRVVKIRIDMITLSTETARDGANEASPSARAH